MSEKEKKDAEETRNLRKELKQLTKEQIALQKELSDMTAEEALAKKDLLDANVQNNMMMAEMMANVGQIAEASKLRAAAEKELMLLQAAHQEAINVGKQMEADIAAAKLAIEKEDTEEAREQLKVLEEKKQLHIDSRKELEAHLDNLEQRVVSLKDVTKEYDNLSVSGKKVYEQSHKAFEQIGVLGLGIVKVQDTMVGKSLMFAKTLMDARKGADGLKLAFKETFNVANIGSSLAQKVVESFIFMFTAVDKAGASFAAATGTGREFVGMLEDGVKAGNDLGVNFDNMGKSLQGLYENMIGFTHLSKDMQQSLSVQVAQFERLGIASNDAADLMNTFSKTMGASAQEAVNLTRRLSMMGSTIGISSKLMIKNFQTAQKTLAVYGKGALKVFTNLSAAAKAAGVEMSTLLGIAGQFDTFESAADSVGKLNAILGANMSATQVLMQTEDERIETIIQSINMSGESFSQMDRFKQKAIANAAGITDMAEANKIFGMSMSQYRQYSNEMKNAETSQTKFQEMVKATIPIQEMFQQMIIEFAPKVTPLLEMVRTGLELVIWALHGLNKISFGTFPYILFALGMYATWMKISAARAAVSTAKTMADTVAKMANAATSLENAVAKGVEAGAIDKQTQSQVRNQAATKSSIGPMLAFGAAAMMIGAGIAMAANGLANFVSAFGNLNAEQIQGAKDALVMLGIGMLVLVGVLLILAYAGAAAILPMLGLGAAILLIGLGVMIAALGLATMIEAMGTLVGQIASMGSDGAIAAASFYMIASGIGAIALAGATAYLGLWFFNRLMGKLSVSATGMGMGFTVASFGLTAISAILPSVVDGMAALEQSAPKVNESFAKLAGGLGVLAIGIAAMVATLAMPPLGPFGAVIAMGLLAAGIRGIAYAMSEVDTSNLERLARVAQGIETLMTMPTEITAVAKVNEDLKDLKQTMDATLMSQISSLNTFQNVEAINTVKAQTQADNVIVIKPSDVHITTNTTTEVDGQQFTKATHEAMKKINWRTSNVAEKLFVEGKQQVVGG